MSADPIATIACLTCHSRVFGEEAQLRAELREHHEGHRFGPMRAATTDELVDLVMGQETLQ